MATSTEEVLATEEHRREQARTSAPLVREVLSLWPLPDPLGLDATAPAWLRLVLDHDFVEVRASTAMPSDVRPQMLGATSEPGGYNVRRSRRTCSATRRFEDDVPGRPPG